MTGTNRQQDDTNRRKAGKADLDHTLDAALANYAAVEPRAGLEERILANLRAEPARVSERVWWQLPLAIGATAIVVLAVGLVLRSGRHPQPSVKNPPAVTTPATKQPDTQAATHNPDAVRLARDQATRHQPTHATVQHSARSETVAAAPPRLDQFPSPRPLSEQEKLLASYIAQEPQRAALVAEARMEVLRKDQEEEQQEMTDEGRDTQPRDTKSR
jgi:hypothetical protein